MKKKLMSVLTVLIGFWIVGSVPGAYAALSIDISGSPSYQQTTNNPCVIGDPSCSQGGFTYTSESGPAVGGVYDLFSPTYTIGSGATVVAPDILPLSFMIGIDVNWAGSKPADLEKLEYFKTYVNGVYSAANSWIGPDGGLAYGTSNGNGYSDAVLSGFSFTAGQSVFFEARWNNDTDGMEEFFVIPAGTPPAVPEPGTMLLLGSGLVGLAGWGRKKFRK